MGTGLLYAAVRGDLSSDGPALLANPWGVATLVEVYVGYLRRKLGRDAVRTVRNVGYQLTGGTS